MKTQLQFRRSRRSGFATLVALTLLAVMGALLVYNNHVLYGVKEDLKLVNEKQLKKFAPAENAARPPSPATAPKP